MIFNSQSKDAYDGLQKDPKMDILRSLTSHGEKQRLRHIPSEYLERMLSSSAPWPACSSQQGREWQLAWFANCVTH